MFEYNGNTNALEFATTIQSSTYTYDLVGNILSITPDNTDGGHGDIKTMTSPAPSFELMAQKVFFSRLL